MQHWNQQLWVCLHLTQTNFCDQFFTLMNVTLLHHLLQIWFCSHTVFINFCAVFDVVNHSQLNTVLKAHCCSFSIQNLLQSLMTYSLWLCVLINKKQLIWFDWTCDLLQRSPFFLLLFNLYINDFMWQLNLSDLTAVFTVYFYVNNKIMLKKICRKMQQTLDCLKTWC